ncbi:hypothetical protein [Larkinella soli]|uniref:hypothetical protein n=1 Tax=Larkinella soli TaxID=1770527 RepID=UPI000FFBCAE1|nr:hypothetical protein [Larkinella soli]
MMYRTLIIWFLMLLLAVLNGAFREAVIRPQLGQPWGHVLSTALLCMLIGGLAWYSVGWIKPHSLREAWGVGLTWVSLTLAFEFLAGHYLFGRSWNYLLDQYDLMKGQVWLFVPLVTLLAPVWVFRLRMPV